MMFQVSLVMLYVSFNPQTRRSGDLRESIQRAWRMQANTLGIGDEYDRGPEFMTSARGNGRKLRHRQHLDMMY